MSNSRIFLRKVLRLSPSRCAALIWLPRVAVNDSEISGNTSVGNNVGYAIMFSDKLRILGNVSDGDRDHGLLLVVVGHLVQSQFAGAGDRLVVESMCIKAGVNRVPHHVMAAIDPGKHAERTAADQDIARSDDCPPRLVNNFRRD